MPTYDYECKKCSYKFEIFQSIKDQPLTDCPQCKGEVKRLIGGGMGVIFKGSGFYTTDYKKSSTSTSAGPAKESKTQNTTAAQADTSASEAKTAQDSSSKETKKDSDKASKKTEALAS